MYFPYLRGKQFDLMALREFATANPNNRNIFPIIEPVKDTFNTMRIAIDCFFTNNQQFALVLNPELGDFKKTTEEYDIIESLPTLSEHMNNWTPAFIFSNVDNIRSIIDTYGLENVMIIFPNGINTSNPLISDILNDNRVKYIVNGEPESPSAMRLLRSLTGKFRIRLDNKFIEKPRNVDYIGLGEDVFSEICYYYRDDDKYQGFSDYTTLPKDFIDGGMQPYAIAIHLTYDKNDEKIYIQHFVSDSNYDQSNVQGKFAEAVKKVATFFQDKPQTPALKSLIQLYVDEKYPGLGFIKKLSIRNHIELIDGILTSIYHENM